jgi:hypothetical protein
MGLPICALRKVDNGHNGHYQKELRIFAATINISLNAGFQSDTEVSNFVALIRDAADSFFSDEIAADILLPASALKCSYPNSFIFNFVITSF